ncbi:hypothetical protein KY321_05775 [Candidatus Woesearchaeota archaeon]|nr:hypothetical protein [Candidatus Woesearchaeota archaeon]
MTKDSKKDSWTTFLAATGSVLLLANIITHSIKNTIPRLHQDGIKNHLIQYGNKPKNSYPLYHEVFKTESGETIFTGYNLNKNELYIVTEEGLNGIVKESIHVSEDGKFICDQVNSRLSVSPEVYRQRVMKIAYERAKRINDYNSEK